MSLLQKILVVAAHPDDEILGCGAAIAKYAAKGCECHTLIMAEGATSRAALYNKSQWEEDLQKLREAASCAAGILSVRSVRFADLPDNRMDSLDLLDVIKIVEDVIKAIKPQIVVTHHGGDVNIDHQITHRAVVTACRPLPDTSLRTLLFFETPSSTEYQVPSTASMFMPDWFEVVDEEDMKKKMQALHCYESEMREWPHSRSYKAVHALAEYRGFSIGHEYAEAFVLGRFMNN